MKESSKEVSLLKRQEKNCICADGFGMNLSCPVHQTHGKAGDAAYVGAVHNVQTGDAACEGCDGHATHWDTEGVPLCDVCFYEAVQEQHPTELGALRSEIQSLYDEAINESKWPKGRKKTQQWGIHSGAEISTLQRVLNVISSRIESTAAIAKARGTNL